LKQYTKSQASEFIERCLVANENLVMIYGLAAMLGVDRDEAVRLATLCGYQVQNWGSIEYITDDNKPGALW
jgi:hypothetical protein